MTATDAQVRIMMRERQKGRTPEQAAASANVRSRKTVTKYEQLGQLPSALVKPRQYRTRQDAFAEDRATLESDLSAATGDRATGQGPRGPARCVTSRTVEKSDKLSRIVNKV